ncbi:Monoterpene synthase 25 [Psilocybe cubensis]|uniref:Monoterpene synthase 25 n=2 Tax=Psilocybe cubensis TaxID=181762 RepID=A0ACB8GPN4_PSICU|nr:Monoterpene synthase 25 [Psilocybe cubensis]KAH9477608.1 Monoterpene synthase 25 [Psilocybe cubensis]
MASTALNTPHSEHSASFVPSKSLISDYENFDAIKEIYSGFIDKLEYSTMSAISDDNETFQALLSEFASYNTGRWFEALCRESSTIAELGYANHSPAVRLQAARFTWYLIYVDDLGQKFPSMLEGFQERLLTCKDPEGSFLQAFRAHLADMYKFWDPLPANCITLAGIDFINGCLLEQSPEISEMRLSKAATSWPYFLRNKTGSAAAYGFFLFPKELNVDMTTYIQVMEDIVFYTNLTNDILSFYKEDIAGERNNYIYNRAHVSHQSAIDALRDTVKDTLDAHARITEVLKGTNAYASWKTWVNGYIGFHTTLKRYRLDDLGIA